MARNDAYRTIHFTPGFFMDRFHPLAAALLAAALFGVLHSGADAQEIYKWTDGNGKVHYGDRTAAPVSSTKLAIPAAPRRQPSVVPASAAGAQRHSSLMSHSASQRKSVPVNPALVAPACKQLIEKIAVVPAGTNWEALYRQFDSACPGIAYECVEYRSSPENNRCMWVERLGSRVLNRSRYP